MSRLQDYEVVQIMGTGTFGTCFKVKNKLTQKLFVWKAIDCGRMNEEKKAQLTTELNLLKQFNHPHIVQYFNHIVNKVTDTLYIIMECCDGGDLALWIARCRTEKSHFEEDFIWRSLYQISKAIHACYSHKKKITVLHRDIKPANVFLDGNGNIKIGDYGLAALSTNESNANTSFYMSAEEIKNTKYKQRSDIWSLGCLIFEMCTSSPPARGRRTADINCESEPIHAIPKLYSADMQKFIDFMLTIEHGYRPTVEVILHHPTVLANLRASKPCMPVLVPDSSPPDFTLCSDMTISKLENECGDSNSTNALRKELFTSSPKRKLQSHLSGCSSEPEQTDSKRSTPITFRAASDFMACKYKKPDEIAKEVFNQAFKLRLQAIKDRECDLSQREKEMKEREQKLMRREKHVRSRPASRMKQRRSCVTASDRDKTDREQINMAGRKASNMHDVSYISIDTNDVEAGPTMAKINLDRLYRPKTFEKKVSFHRPSIKFQDIENIPPPIASPTKTKSLKDPKTKRVANVDEIKSNRQNSQDKRKSFFSLFSLNLNHLKKGNKPKATMENKTLKTDDKDIINNVEQQDSHVAETLSNKWTAETKRTAFEMLAIMNAADVIDNSQDSTVVESMVINNNIVRHDRKRQSMLVLRR